MQASLTTNQQNVTMFHAFRTTNCAMTIVAPPQALNPSQIPEFETIQVIEAGEEVENSENGEDENDPHGEGVESNDDENGDEGDEDPDEET